MNRVEKVLAFINDDSYLPHTFFEIAALLDVPKSDFEELEKILLFLEDSGEIIKTKKKRYISVKKAGYVRGKYRGNQRGFGFVIPDDGSDDVFIAAQSSLGALDGDVVLAGVTSKEKDGKKREGEIVRVFSFAE